jgi:ABC-type multidrug transport system fused ATPase/permease subunit
MDQSHTKSLLAILKSAFYILDQKKRIKLIGASLVQVITAGLDLIGVALIGVLGALTIQGIESKGAGNRVSSVLKFLRIENLSLHYQVTAIGVLAIFFFVLRTFMTVLLTRRALRFLSFQAASISSILISNLLKNSILTINKRSVQKTIYILNEGVYAITMGLLGSIVSLIADASLLIVMSLGLFFLDPIIALETMTLFIIVGILVYAILNKKASELGRQYTLNRLEGNEQITQVLHSFREILVRGRRDYYIEINRKNRSDSAQVLADSAFLPNIGKYAIEATVLVGTFVIGAIQFARHDAVHAAATLSVFLAAGSRVAPAVLRLQQSAIQIRNSVGIAEPAFELISEVGVVRSQILIEALDANIETDLFSAEIELENLNFSYPEKSSKTINNLSLRVRPGELVAFVGPSGAGKTTLIDLILGVLNPDSGEIKISGLDPLGAIKKWPGVIGYVPQDVVIVNGTIRENITLGFEPAVISDSDVLEALDIAHLRDFIETLPDGLDTEVGERGTKLSGGQRQRLGIARAMFTKPKLLVLDEATSSLDGETEAAISSSIHSLAGKVTVILIAHRLSTVREANQVVYLESGRAVASGSFNEVRESVPNFDSQAKLMGL